MLLRREERRQKQSDAQSTRATWWWGDHPVRHHLLSTQTPISPMEYTIPSIRTDLSPHPHTHTHRVKRVESHALTQTQTDTQTQFIVYHTSLEDKLWGGDSGEPRRGCVFFFCLESQLSCVCLRSDPRRLTKHTNTAQTQVTPQQ